MPENGEIIMPEDGNPRYDKIIRAAQTVMHVAKTESLAFPAPDRHPAIVSMLNAALTNAILNYINEKDQREMAQSLHDVLIRNIEEMQKGNLRRIA